MAFKIAEIYTELTVHDSGFNKKIRRAKKDLSSAATNALQLAGVLAGMGIAAGVVGTKLVRMAADARETLSKFQVVFKDQSAATLKWADDFANATNRSKFALRGFLASAQDLFVPMGFARKEAAELSKQAVTLATDLSSFSNVPVAAVMRDIQSALVGNTETVRKYGVQLNVANTEQAAMELTGKKSVKILTLQDKMMGRLKLIMDGTVDAQGDAVRTASSLANQLVRLDSDIEDVSIQLGEALVPAAYEFLKVAKELAPVLKDTFGPQGGGTQYIKEFTDGIGAAIEMVSGLANMIAGLMGREILSGDEMAWNIRHSQGMLGDALASTGVFKGGAAPAVKDTGNLIELQKEQTRLMKRGNRNTAQMTAIGK